ncbi:MAG: hypothetical protein ACRDTZ_10100 [Pseudonocardiaceae bacterium]
MSVGDLAFVVALSIGPAIFIVSIVLLLVLRQPRWVRATVVALGAVTVASFAAYAYVWGRAFDHADANQPVPRGIDLASNATLLIFVCAGAAVVTLGAARLVIALNGDASSGGPIPARDAA